ncbi:3-methyladenine DNA glycosylase [Methanocella sp. CWC-04]|uniref:Putative 3-methyladenine DNA glycosylase n=1 Tax=Methanooceanicella nereidis TaxID=2052831 RepID=A0AAP2RDX6_9EURY|nr:DNA-3-methyladenine glycosylase [Methanocella sp. CWC-04]MCD1295357.1 3-methyladenine DNA glycosylase [Methanocella sp. CWC-04]
MSANKIVPRSFFDRPTVAVAKDLLGKALVREHPVYGKMAARIVETEAYVGMDDKACHASKGMTERNKVMFGEPGHAYVYMIYGMYFCLNLVTEHNGFPAAVLIRAGEPLEGIEAMKKLRGDKVKKLRDLTSGPGKLCKAMGINREQNGIDLCKKGELYVVDLPQENYEIVESVRIGVDYAEEDRLKPWRFYVKGNPYVSKKDSRDE